VTIADRFGVSLNELRSWNKITGIKVAPGRRLHVAEPVNQLHAVRGHRRGASAEAGADAPEMAPGKGSTEARAPSAGKKRNGASAGKKEYARRRGTPSARKPLAKKPAAKGKSQTKKQKQAQ
jgi:membrane-bound lytic murein transglycosylase D